MQQSPPSPTPAPRAPTSIAVPDGAIPLENIPQTTADLRGLRERREILRDQLERAGTRRTNLVNQLDGRGGPDLPPEARAGVQQRLDALDDRILQIERDQAVTERLLSQAPPSLLAQETQDTRNYNSKIDEDEAAGMAFGMFTFGILLTLVVGRIRRFRARRRGGAVAASALAAATDPRIDRLAQAVDAIAEEVERIGEGQRFVTQLLANRPETGAMQAIGAQPGEAQARSVAPYRP